jgi:predicted enzyme related to lactoylglutathione lyase
MIEKARVFGMAVLCIAAINAGCGDSGAPAMQPNVPGAGAGSQTTSVNGTPSAGAGGAAVSMGAAGSAAAPASPPQATGGTKAPAAAGSTGSAAGSTGSVVGGSAGSVGGSSGSLAANGGSSAPAAGTSAAAGGSGGAAGVPPGDFPMPVSAPQIWGFGIGITDVPAAVKFYTEVMKMTVEKDAVKREDRTETILYGTQAMRGARVVLMKFDDMRNTRKITTKLVWQAQNPSAVNAAAAMHPDYVSRLNVGIVQFDGPETYIQEVGSIFDDGGSAITVPYPIAMGFAVSDQPASRKFYTSLGMTESSLGSFSVTDATGTGTIGEYTVKFADGMGAVVQQWTPMRNAKDNPVKLIMMVPDAQATADKVAAAGGMIVKPAERSPVYDNRLLVIAKDLDGYMLEIVQ